jgi:hypothetical protein
MGHGRQLPALMYVPGRHTNGAPNVGSSLHCAFETAPQSAENTGAPEAEVLVVYVYVPSGHGLHDEAPGMSW